MAAVGHELVHQGHAVFFTTVLAAKQDLSLARDLPRLDRFDCLCLDDIGYVQQERAETDALFTLLAERYQRRRVLITSNLVFSNPVELESGSKPEAHHS